MTLVFSASLLRLQHSGVGEKMTGCLGDRIMYGMNFLPVQCYCCELAIIKKSSSVCWSST